MHTSLLWQSTNCLGPKALLSSLIQVSEIKASPRHSTSKRSPSGTSKTCCKLELSDLWFEVLGVINTCKYMLFCLHLYSAYFLQSLFPFILPNSFWILLTTWLGHVFAWLIPHPFPAKEVCHLSLSFNFVCARLKALILLSEHELPRHCNYVFLVVVSICSSLFSFAWDF